MDLNKLLYVLSKQQSLVISSELTLIKSRCLEAVNAEKKDMINSQISHDNTCPKCRTNDNIVVTSDNKNHCDSCGHEWGRFKMKNTNSITITKVVLNYLSDVITEPEKNIDCEWKLESIQMFDGCHAESLYNLQMEINELSEFPLRHPLTLNQLKTKYDSVLDYSN